MKIAMMTNNYKPYIGGVPISVERLAGGLRELGHEVIVFAPDYEGVGQEENVVRCRSYTKKSMKGMGYPGIYSLEIEKKFREIPFDVIHVHHPVCMGTMALYFGKKYNIPVAYTYHTRYEEYLHYFKTYSLLEQVSRHSAFSAAGRLADTGKKLVLKGMRAFTNRCDMVIAPTEKMEEFLLLNGTKSRIQVMPTGLDASSYVEDREASEKIREKFIGSKRFLLCCVSRLEKEKNMEFLIRGVKKLKEKIGGCFRLMLVGDGNERQALEILCRELEITDNVVFIGKAANEEVKNYQFASDLFVFASKSETQGIVLLEAMAAGRPVIAVKASGVVDVVKDGINGFMTAEDVEEWASYIKRTLLDASLRKSLEEGARESAECFRAEQIAFQAERAYASMLYERAEKERQREWFPEKTTSFQVGFLGRN